MRNEGSGEVSVRWYTTEYVSTDLLNDCMLRLSSFWSPGNIGLDSILNLSLLRMDLAGAVKGTPCKRILLQVRYIRPRRLEAG